MGSECVVSTACHRHKTAFVSVNERQARHTHACFCAHRWYSKRYDMIWCDTMMDFYHVEKNYGAIRYDTIWDGILFVIVLTENDSLRAFKELVDLWRTRATPTNICGFKQKILVFSLVLYGYKRFIVCAYEELNWFKRNFNLFMQFRRDEARDVCEWVYIFLMNVRYHIHGLKRLLCNRETEGECEWERGRESTVMFFRANAYFDESISLYIMKSRIYMTFLT